MKQYARHLLAIATVIGIAGYLLFQTPNKQAPDIKLTSIEGKNLNPSALKNQIILVNFWATSCTGCIQEMPELIKLQEKYKNNNYKTIAIAMDYDNPEYIANYVKEKKLPFFVQHDINGKIAKSFGDVGLTPSTFLINKKGEIIKKYVGVADIKEIESLIEEEIKKS
ncbi:TlpA disulfide reductase family protein [Iodobacter arcticus]|uniref:TlpA disulfide reductase family protein n=1 Tax=Iodobacter arcticus TaxID=590593 RepID=A0ABW2QSY9_9NEIS